MNKILFVVSGLAALAGGCASPEAGTPNEAVVERVYPTGSNLPRKQKAGETTADGVTVYDRDAAESLINRQMPPPRPMSGGKAGN